jgi:hypothetical protein
LNNLAWLLAECPDHPLRDGKKAVEFATRACRLSAWKDSYYLGTLGAAYAQEKDFSQAAKWQRAALELTPGYSDADRQKGAQRLLFYEAGQPFPEINKSRLDEE